MSPLKRHIRTTINTIFIATALMTAGAMESKANKFDRGFLPPAAKARRSVAHMGSVGSRVRVSAGDVNGDGRAEITGRNRARRFAQPRQSANLEVWDQPVIGYRQNRRGVNRQSYLLPYIEQDNLYRLEAAPQFWP